MRPRTPSNMIKSLLNGAFLCLLVSTPHFSQAQVHEWSSMIIGPPDIIVGGNTIKFAEMSAHNTYYLTDPRIPQNDPNRTIWVDVGIPEKLNGEKVYCDGKIRPVLKNTTGRSTFSSVMLSSLGDEFAQLSDGEYRLQLNHIVVDKKGKIVYYDTAYSGIEFRHYSKRSIPMVQARAIKDKLFALLNKIEMIPPTVAKKSVPSCILEPFVEKTIVVKNHEVTIL